MSRCVDLSLRESSRTTDWIGNDNLSLQSSIFPSPLEMSDFAGPFISTEIISLKQRELENEVQASDTRYENSNRMARHKRTRSTI